MLAMRPLLAIWRKVIINPFFQVNTGFFFFWVMLLVVFQNPSNRLFTDPFLSSVIQTPVDLLVILAALLLYFFKCYQYVRAKLALPEHDFLFIVSLLPPQKVGLSWLLVFGSLYAPALFYLSLLTRSALKLSINFISFGLPGFSLLLAIFFAAYFTFFHRQLKTDKSYKFGFPFRLFPAYNHYSFIFSKYIWHEAKGLFLLSKVFLLTAIWAFLKVYPPAEYGLRPAAFGFLMGLLGHCLLVFRTHVFEEERLLLLRQLPLHTQQRILLLLLAYGFTLLPELLFLLSYLQVHFPIWGIFTFYIFGCSFLLLLHTFLYRPITQDKYYRQIFFLFISLLFMILFSVPLWLLAVLSMGLNISLLHRHYYRFEATW
ncbi:hypothetical protein [Adhaeribacter radiodurans]|uniref:Uncharacterized protein n=1 Tax=Adhaeribacter radiodurans TaxID=2745197 RepID=A0A7L7LAM3_9BACT|nr:hypothetical protein [Adhaeribacter radiodurans]QMU29787.1 hypothetical protein HUW48_17945 [Adhaeribacter radiodurans]